MAGFFKKAYPDAIVSATDITKAGEIKQAVREAKPTIVVNTAAKTSIDWCEQNKPQAFAVNTLGAFNRLVAN